MSLSNQAILISGANRGIGAATVRELLKAGARKVYAGARNVQSLPDFGDSRVVPLGLDVTDEKSVAAAAAAAKDVDVLINNAGTLGFGDWLTSTQEVIELDMNTNYYGTLRVIQAFTPQLLARRSGTIANVISIVGLAPASVLAGYSASKAALHSLTLTLRGSLKPSGIRVVGIYPGPIDTELVKNLPVEKVTTEYAAANIVRGLEEGQTEIYPDPLAQKIGQLWAPSGPQLEAALQNG